METEKKKKSKYIQLKLKRELVKNILTRHLKCPDHIKRRKTYLKEMLKEKEQMKDNNTYGWITLRDEQDSAWLDEL